ncbi:hypothetical protein [Psychrobacillus sp.]|uniref:hypothetical protein n=1 Tax=Psychrobacillus sp. TaxID=1871623 RepID=UPI0028BE242D|nr:hypothetical protein [Psychrobacillus sp.]
MSYLNDPLLFVKAPPVAHRPADIQEESTSIYEKPKSMSEQTEAILEQLHFLSNPFQRKVYRPLVFHLEDGELIQGEVKSVDDEFVTFVVGSGEAMTYRIDQVEKIFWRGNILK